MEPQVPLEVEELIAGLRKDLSSKEIQLSELKATYEEFTRSSKELEDEMEQELNEADDAMKELRESNGRLEAQIEDLEKKLEEATKSLLKAEEQLQSTQKSEQESKRQCRDLEVRFEEVQEEERRASSELGMLRAQVERMEEEKIFAVMDLEELKREASTKEERQRQQINELREEVIALTPIKKSIIKHTRNNSVTSLSSRTSSFDGGQNPSFRDNLFSDVKKMKQMSQDGDSLREQLAAAQSRIKELERELERLLATVEGPKQIHHSEELCSISLNGLHVSCLLM
mmetsp:Transcript_34113/g.45094  ORF Transcript_34113/g.45094 Transcript_34113/m.45094 type:complete len:286 (-) Transcript_34113:53-910(-)|eukprot:CAMPEP_0117758766 /NCGR_PEP_ID=MMETSP0947-20121206/15603_1 /TAXON_ID=44440 /ORGANISM="Chattonella subsalsa, Strain CCMP2191" /LENGTH=285 /DNA_ID=CAMNT_0005579075 /DNA_START=345 /DNA_END=1202 /DNA_ORIENTATION=-